MIDHVTLNVKDVGASSRFYEVALAPLQYSVIVRFPEGVGFGQAGKPDFWIASRPPSHTQVHIAFRCQDRKAVDEFYRAALKAGGRDNGPPGVRAHYHANYYGAFVFDPDGNNIEAVCHDA